MKKLLVVLFIIATLVLALASCGECEHNFQEKEVIKSANCITDGKKLMECSECGETKEEVIPKNGIHDPEREEIEPTCKEPGKIITTCKVEGCDYRNESEGKKPTGLHTPTVEIVTEPTCTEDGEQKRVCAVCGDEAPILKALSPQQDTPMKTLR